MKNKKWKQFVTKNFSNTEGLASTLDISTPTAQKYIQSPEQMKVKHVHIIAVTLGIHPTEVLGEVFGE